jgi:hypothetical protein
VGETAAAGAMAAGDIEDDDAEGSRTDGSLSTTDLERGFAEIRSAMDYAMGAGPADGGWVMVGIDDGGLRGYLDWDDG